MLIMTSILIAGSGGYVGTFLTKQLSEEFDVIAISRDTSIHSEQIKNTIKHDLAHPWKFTERPDIIIYLAAQHGFSRPEGTIENFLRSNIHGLHNSLTFAKSSKVKLFIYLSTISVLGEVQDKIVTETTPLNDPDFYGTTKFLGEKLVQTFSEAIPSITIRLPGVVGPNLPPGRPWLHTIAKSLQSDLEVKYYNPGSLFNNVCDVWTIRDFVKHVCTQNHPKNYNLVNLAASEPILLNEMIELMRDRLQSTSLLTTQKTNKCSFTIDTSILLKEFNFLPATTLDMITRFMDGFNCTTDTQH